MGNLIQQDINAGLLPTPRRRDTLMSDLTFSSALLCSAALVLALIMPIAAISASPHLANPTMVVSDKPMPRKNITLNCPFKDPNIVILEISKCAQKFFNLRVVGTFPSGILCLISEQYLVISVAPLHREPSGRLTFAFADGSGNQGIGSVEYPDAQHVLVDLKATKKTDLPPDRNILRQYGVNVLPEGPCPADHNPETFGGGHAVWPP